MSIWTVCILIAFSSGSGWKGECSPAQPTYKCVPTCVRGRGGGTGFPPDNPHKNHLPPWVRGSKESSHVSQMLCAC